MFIDILIVSILTPVQLESLIRPICQLQRFSARLFVNFKPQTNSADKGVLLLYIKDKTHSFFEDDRQRVCGSLKIYSVFWENFVVF